MQSTKLENTPDNFSALVDQLHDAVIGGYKENKLLIINLMKKFSDNNMVVHWFIQNFCHKPEIRKMRGAQSFYLIQNKSFSMRLNLWFPDNKLPENVSVRYDKYFSIGVLHNHNFDFFTVGVYGPGYQSDFFLSQEDLADKNAGDLINFDDSWSLKLGQGDSIFVARDSEFHVQYAPESLSMSLNLIPHQPRLQNHKQFIMKNDRKTIEYSVLPDAFS
jgi:hypothetical protein